MYAFEQMMARGYHVGAPSQEAEAIDAQVAERQRCPKCEGSMHYLGFHRNGPGHREYVALAVCNRCSHTVSF